MHRSKRSGKTKQAETVFASVGMYFEWLLQVGAVTALALVLFAMPVYFRQGYTHIGSDKSFLYRTAAECMAKILLPVFGIYAVCYLGDRVSVNGWKEALREIAASFRLEDRCMLLYALSVVASFLFSRYRETALVGTKGWYMGMFPQLTAVSLYFLLSRFAVRPKGMIYLSLPVSAGVYLLAILNRFDIWPLKMENSGLKLYISTVGNINWYCGYVVCTLFLVMGLFCGAEYEKCRERRLLCVYLTLGFGTLFTQGSASGVFALAAVMLFLFVFAAWRKDADLLERFFDILICMAAAGILLWIICRIWPKQINYTTSVIRLFTVSSFPFALLLFAVAGRKLCRDGRVLERMPLAARLTIGGAAAVFVLLFGMILANTLHPGCLGALSERPVFTFGPKWGSSRGATWTSGLMCFGEQDALHKLTGVGPDCMADYLYGDGSEEVKQFVKTYFKNRRLTNAHCEMLTTLVNEGLAGALSLLAVYGVLLVRFLKSHREKSSAFACGLALLGYMANNIWSFQQSMSLATIFAILGMGEYFLRRQKHADRQR